ncbi:hypothetical protein C8R44DRAFT_764087 [Mycena epipterygia]|nr:hypothetical protein C8R44DRAFT_774521 [Mycena epipterygia]KAJ7139225.1 hypothetical protein C8R44DRAFT_764087 [Mycena epipterygia]
MPKGPPKRFTAPRGPDGMFLSTQSHPNTSGSLDKSENLSSGSDSDIGALESDSELEQDPDYTEDWEWQPQPTTFEERRKINEEKRARIYRLGATGPIAEFAVKRYRSHRGVQARDLDIARAEWEKRKAKVHTYKKTVMAAG